MYNELYGLSKGLKKARKQKGLKQSEVAVKMGVHLKTVMNWEQGISTPDLETAMKLADLLECDLDYLTNRIQERTHDIHFIHEYTGLSEKAIEKISSVWTIDDGISVEKVGSPEALGLSHLIEADGFKDFIYAYLAFMAVTDRLKKSEIPEGMHNVIDQGAVVLRIDKAARFFMQDVAQELLNLCESDFRESYETCRKNSKKKKDENVDTHDDRRKE